MQSGRTYRDSIREKMAEVGWTQADLAFAARISPSALSRFFNTPDRDIDVSTLLRIADALRVPAGDLFPHTTEAVPQDVAPLMQLVLEQPTELRQQLEEMARMVVATWQSGYAAARIGRNVRVGQDLTHTTLSDVTPVTGIAPPVAQHPSPSSAIPGVERTAVSVLSMGPEIGGTSDAKQQQQRRKHSNKKAEDTNNHGDSER